MTRALKSRALFRTRHLTFAAAHDFFLYVLVLLDRTTYTSDVHDTISGECLQQGLRNRTTYTSDVHDTYSSTISGECLQQGLRNIGQCLLLLKRGGC
jgi:hypothetical protein